MNRARKILIGIVVAILLVGFVIRNFIIPCDWNQMFPDMEDIKSCDCFGKKIEFDSGDMTPGYSGTTCLGIAYNRKSYTNTFPETPWEKIEGSKITEKDKKDYYDSYRKKCAEMKNVGCCLSSVENAEKESSFIYEDEKIENVKCIGGGKVETQKCIGSYKWCSQEKEASCGIEGDMISDKIKECCPGFKAESLNPQGGKPGDILYCKEIMINGF